MNIHESSGGQPIVDPSPFQEEVVVDYFFAGGGRQEIITDMLHAIAGLIPILVLSGEEGSGKTMMCRAVENEVPPNCIPIFFPETVESFDDVVRIVARSLGVSATATSKTDIFSLLEKIGAQLMERNERLIVIFDQAEQIYLATLERIRKMLDLVNSSGVVLQIVLSGRAMLLENLKQLSICNFEQAEEKKYSLEPLSSEETFAYLQHAAGLLAGAGQLVVFPPDICDTIYNAARGNFRMTNILAEESIKNEGKDESFWVLLENVQDQGLKKAAPGRRTWSRLVLLKALPRLLTYGGTVACAGLLLLWFLAGNDETPVMQLQEKEQVVADEGVLQVEPVQQKTAIGKPAGLSAPVDKDTVTAVAVPDEVGTEKEIKVVQYNDKAAVKPFGAAQKSATNIVAVKAPVSVASPAVQEVSDSSARLAEPKNQAGTEKVQVPAEPEIIADVPVVTESNIVISSLNQREKDDLESIRSKALAREETEKVASAQAELIPTGLAIGSDPVRPADEDAIQAVRQIKEIRLTRPVKVKVEPLPQIEEIRKKIKIPVVEKAIVQQGPRSVVDEIYNRRIAAGRAWLFGGNENRYTVQLMVLTSDTAEENFKQMLEQESYRQEADNFYIFQTRDNPSTLLVFYGEYTSMTDARNARNGIPVFLRGHKPYAISVQGAMRKVKSS